MSRDFNYPPELPVTAHRAEILDSLRNHPVIIVCGDTGSGKTTQLPKMALECFSEAKSPHDSETKSPRIACTQPRRLAAVTMAERVAQELKCATGSLVGYQHRFERKTSKETRIKFMTDGVLLAETRADPLLRSYDVIIVDEAHERSLNIDFLLGILKRILARRKDLHVIISSATLDVERFARFFDNAPVVSVPGRLFPIEIIHSPPREDDDLDLPRDVSSAVTMLPARDDILVFLPGERDIRETADALERRFGDSNDIIPLIASLPSSEQQRAFRPSSRRRIILSTNVAETSVTIPGIRCVIDSGLARISRYIHRTQVQRLQIENISQASARQRSGRCGRLGPGTCIRLYSEEDFNSRDAFTPPEVLRSSLAGVILTMLDHRLGSIDTFPFIDPPKSAMVHEGLRELLELGAIYRDKNGEIALTQIGRKLAKIPVEPRFARMMIAASERGVLPSVIPLVASMSCDDPRRRPVDEREKATQAHAQYRVAGSDFLSTLRLWTRWQHDTKELSQAKQRMLAKKSYLSYPKMREWRDLVRQLQELAKRLDLFMQENYAPNFENIKYDDKDFVSWNARLHQSLLSGLLSHIGKYDEEGREYRGAHGVRFALHPGSVLTKKVADKSAKPEFQLNAHRKNVVKSNQPPQWVMAGELVDTVRLFAREAAVIDPGWIEPVAGGICKHNFHSPEWDSQSGFVRATEQVTLYGIVIVPARRCDYSRVNHVHAREIFIRRGLIDCEMVRPPQSLKKNIDLLKSLRELSEKYRRPEFFDEEKLFSHFDSVIPNDVASLPALNRWMRSDSYDRKFELRKNDWWPDESAGDRDFPSSVTIGGVKMRLSYLNLPDDPERDGITCTAKKCDAGALRLWQADWLVPGALRGKIIYLISVLPSAQRRILQPLEDVINEIMSDLKPDGRCIIDCLREYISERWGIRIAPESWSSVRLPAHMMVRFRIVDESGKEISVSRNLDEALSAAGVEASKVSVAAASHGSKEKRSSVGESSGWKFGVIAETSAAGSAGWKLQHYPALRDEGEKGVALHLFADKRAAEASHASAVTRLFVEALGDSVRVSFRRKQLPMNVQMYLKSVQYEDSQISSDILWGAVRETFVRNQKPVRDGEEFERRLKEFRSQLFEVEAEMTKIVCEAFAHASKIEECLEEADLPSETCDSLQTQLAWLLYRGFAKNVPLARLRHYKRYLKGAEMRIERARLNPFGDRTKEDRLAPYWQLYEDAVSGKSKVKFDAVILNEIRWMIEEFRVSLFAQELKTAEPVSEKRLDAKLASAVID